MSDSTQIEDKNYVRFLDFCTKPDFLVARSQLVREIRKYRAHQIHTSIKDSGIRWSKVLDAMFNDDLGMLRGYKKFKGFRQFRIFVEKVFTKVIDMVSACKLSGAEVTDDITDLYNISEEFEFVKKQGEESNRKRKEILNRKKESMSFFEDEVRLIPKPAHLEPEIVQSPSSFNEVSTDRMLDENIHHITHDCSSKKSKTIHTETIDIGLEKKSDSDECGGLSSISPRNIDFEQETTKSSKKTPSSVSHKKAKP